MPLPTVQGWLIDFRTASAVFGSKSNVRIDHLVERCQAQDLHICHHEEAHFRGDGTLCGPFLDEHYRVFEPDEDVYERCPAIAAAPVGKTMLVRSDAAVFITAIAVSRQFGVISDHLSPRFVTVHDLCALYGVPVLTADQYFDLL